MYLSASTRLNSSQSQGQTGGAFNRRFLARAPARPTLSTDGSLHLQQPVNSRHLTRTLNESTIFHDAKRQPGPYKAVKHRFPLSGFFCVKKKFFPRRRRRRWLPPTTPLWSLTILRQKQGSCQSIPLIIASITKDGGPEDSNKLLTSRCHPPLPSNDFCLSGGVRQQKKKRRPMTKFKREAASHLLLFPSLAPRICTPRVRSGGAPDHGPCPF